METMEIRNQLQQAALAPDFAVRTSELTDKWRQTADYIETVETILRFMEDHPTVNFGLPGPLVHFVERFYGKGYEQKLIESMKRKPTMHTAWMLNRLVNGAKTGQARISLLSVMVDAARSPSLDHETAAKLRHFLEKQGSTLA
jgi:hypothetical protein